MLWSLDMISRVGIGDSYAIRSGDDFPYLFVCDVIIGNKQS